MTTRQNTLLCTVGILISVCLFAIINGLDFARSHYLIDGIYRHGIPLTFYRHGGFQGERTYIWIGLFGDLVIAIAAGIVLANIWIALSTRKFGANEAKSKLLR